jgi:plastocyanin
MTTTDVEATGGPGDGSGEEAGTDLVPAGDGGDLVPAGVGALPRSRPALLEPDADPRAEALRSRLLLPLLLPIASAVAIAFFAINLSRALLAGGPTGALILASIFTLVILGGAAWVSSQPQLSTGALSVILVVLLGFVGATGLTTLGPSSEHGGDEKKESGFVEPAGDPVASLEVDALATLKFQATEFSTIAGVNEFVYVGKGGFHTLVFKESEYRGFKLEVNGEEVDKKKIDLQPGTFTIYCNVPGHEAAGMIAKLVVGDAISE